MRMAVFLVPETLNSWEFCSVENLSILNILNTCNTDKASSRKCAVIILATESAYFSRAFCVLYLSSNLIDFSQNAWQVSKCIF